MRAKDDHFQYGELQSLIVANGHLNVLYLVKGVCQPSFVHWQALQEAVERVRHSAAYTKRLLNGQASRNHRRIGGNRETSLESRGELYSTIYLINTLTYSLPSLTGQSIHKRGTIWSTLPCSL